MGGLVPKPAKAKDQTNLADDESASRARDAAARLAQASGKTSAVQMVRNDQTAQKKTTLGA